MALCLYSTPAIGQTELAEVLTENGVVVSRMSGLKRIVEAAVALNSDLEKHEPLIVERTRLLFSLEMPTEANTIILHDSRGGSPQRKSNEDFQIFEFESKSDCSAFVDHIIELVGDVKRSEKDGSLIVHGVHQSQAQDTWAMWVFDATTIVYSTSLKRLNTALDRRGVATANWLTKFLKQKACIQFAFDADGPRKKAVVERCLLRSGMPLEVCSVIESVSKLQLSLSLEDDSSLSIIISTHQSAEKMYQKILEFLDGWSAIVQSDKDEFMATKLEVIEAFKEAKVELTDNQVVLQTRDQKIIRGVAFFYCAWIVDHAWFKEVKPKID